MAILQLGKTLASSLTSIGRTTSSAVKKGAVDIAKVTSATTKTLDSAAAKNALKVGVLGAGGAGTGVGYLLSRPAIDTDNDGAGDTDVVTYVMSLPNQMLTKLSDPKTLLVIGAVVVLYLVVRK